MRYLRTGMLSNTGNGDSSNLAPSPFPRLPDTVRQPSPDPWAIKIQDKEPTAELTESLEITAKEQVRSGVKLETGKAGSPKPQILQSSNETLVPESDSESEATSTIGENIRGNAENQDPRTGEDLEKVSEGKTSSESQESGPISRPSSSPSERSHHGELPQESPRTSFDEEPKQNRPQVARKVSTKVQELVQHFDTLAKKEDLEAVPIRTASAQGTNTHEDSEGGR